MADVSKIKLPSGNEYNIKDARITGVDSAPTSGSTNVVTSDGVYNAISEVKAVYDHINTQLTSALKYKGTIGTGGTVTSLPASHKVGDVYVVSTAGTYAGKACEVGDYIICKTTGTAANNAHWDVVNGENQVENKSASLAAAGSSATIATVDGTNITVTTPSTWTGVAKTGTVTSVTLKGTSPINVDSETALTTSGTRTISHANSGVTANTYKSVTVNATGHVTAGTNPTTLAGYGITDAKIASGTITLGSNTIVPIINKDTIQSTNPFTPFHRIYISKIDNAFYAANKRFTVYGELIDGETITNVSSDALRSIFDGNYEVGYTIPNGKTLKIHMTFDEWPSSQFPGSPYGNMYMSFYYTGKPKSVSARCYCNYASQGVGWKDLAVTVNSNSAGTNNFCYKIRNDYYAISEFEFTIVGLTTGSYTSAITELEMNLDRPAASRTPFLSKYTAEELYYPLTIKNASITASSFVKSGGTSSQFLKADGSVDSNTYLTSHQSLSNYVKIDPGAAEQTIKSSIGTVNKGVINLYRNNGDYGTFLGFSNGTTEKYLGGIGFKSQANHELYLMAASSTNTPSSTLYKIWNENNHAAPGVTAGTAGTSSATSGATLAVPYVTVNSAGHVTGYGTHTHTISGFSTSDTKVTQTVTSSSNTSWRPLLLGYSYSDEATFAPTTVTNTTLASHLGKFAPKTGILGIVGLNKMTTSGTVETGSNTTVWNTNGGTTSLSGYLTSHQAVSSNNNTATWGSTVTVGKVGSTDLKFTMPSNPNTNTTYTFAEGSTDGAFSVTPSGGSATPVSVHGVVTSSNITNYTGNTKLFHGICNTAAATVAKVVECEDFKSTDLVRGAAILVTFDVANTGAVGSLTMNVNSTGAFPIKKNYNTGVGNLTSAAEIRASTYLCTFYDKDNTKYWVISGLDYNSTYYAAGLSVYERRYIHGTDTPLYRYKICGMDATGKLVPLTITDQTSATIVSKTPTNVGFSISRGLFYYASTTNITTTTSVTPGTVLYEFTYITTPQYTFNTDIATYSDVYLKGTAYGDIFTLDTTSNTSWYVQVKHGSAAATYNNVFESGAYYMYVGSSYSTANYFQISVSNPVFYFDGEQLTCPPALRYDRSNTFRVIGKGDTLLTTYHITDIIPGHTYRAWIKSWDDSGVTVQGTDYIKLSIRSYKSDGTYTGLVTRYTQHTLNDYYDIIIPSDCVSLAIAGRITNGTLGEIFLEDITSIGGSSSGGVDLKDTIPQISDETLPRKELTVEPDFVLNSQYVNTSNEFVSTSNIASKTSIYLVHDDTDYYIDCYAPANTASVPAVFRRASSPYALAKIYDFGHPGKKVFRQLVNWDNGTTTDTIGHLCLFYSGANSACLHKVQRILFLGSSWHMNTWWYLNKMFEAANMVVDIHGYYMGHSQFVEWTQLYNNDLTPLTGDEANRDARYCTSINGANWTSHVFNDTFTSEASTLTAQQYRDAFYNDLTAGNWDIIAFQQGANQGPFWEYWSYYKDLVSILKRHAGQSCVLAFNSTWAPAIGNYRLDQFGDRTIVGQKAWQQGNYDCTRRFMAESGIHTVAPNGAMLWAMRQNSTLNVSDVNDLTSDGVHPRHGLAMYGLSVCWWKTYIEPIYGIKIEDVDWLPDSSTQKVHFNGTTFQTISAAQQQLIFKCADLALSDRFGFRTI